MNKLEVGKVLATLGAAYRLDVDPLQLVVWNESLNKYSAEAVEQAAREWIESQPRFPNPSQLIETTQSVLRRRAHENAEQRGLAEAHDEPLPELPRRRTLAKLGMAEARAALEAGRARAKKAQPEPEQGDEE